MTQQKRQALSLMIESVLKPDNELRLTAHDEGCYNELMEIREEMISFLKDKYKQI